MSPAANHSFGGAVCIEKLCCPKTSLGQMASIRAAKTSSNYHTGKCLMDLQFQHSEYHTHSLYIWMMVAETRDLTPGMRHLSLTFLLVHRQHIQCLSTQGVLMSMSMNNIEPCCESVRRAEGCKCALVRHHTTCIKPEMVLGKMERMYEP